MRPVDVGRLALSPGLERYFLSWAGVGFDAQISRTLKADPVRKKQLGPFAFALSGFLMLRDFAGHALFACRIDGHPVSRRMLMLVANNIQLYGIIFRMAQHAVIDDGCFDLYGFRGDSPWRTLLHAVRLLANRHIDDPAVDIYRARRLEITTQQAHARANRRRLRRGDAGRDRVPAPCAASVDADPGPGNPLQREPSREATRRKRPWSGCSGSHATCKTQSGRNITQRGAAR